MAYQYGQAGPYGQPAYGPTAYGPPPAYGPPAYGQPPPYGQAVGGPYGQPPHSVARSDSQMRRGSKYYPETAANFSDASIRRGFIRKVYMILSVQLLVTGGVIAAFLFVDQVKEYVQKNIWLRIVAPRQSPQNFICLGLFTLSMAFLTAVVTSQYSELAVLIAVLITAVVTIALTIFAMQTKIDFTLCAGLLFVGVIVLIAMGIAFAIAQMVFGYSKYYTLIYSGLGALVFSAFLVYDTQMILGGRREQLSEEEYIFAAATLYIDIIYLFCDILSLVGNNM